MITLMKTPVRGGAYWALVIAGFVLVACAGGARAKQGAPRFDEVRGKDWKLVEIRTGSVVVPLNRQRLEADAMGDVYTLRFDADRISGKGAPNRYFGPYELGDGDRLILSGIARTLMMGINQPEELKESEYFDYLDRITRWGIGSDRLELFTETPEGQEAVLVFSGM
jgi:heat shock protein HslJ